MIVLQRPDLSARVGTDEWDGPPSRCEDAVAYLYYNEELGVHLVIITCPHCDRVRIDE